MADKKQDSKSITFFLLPYCRHCLRARRLISKFLKNNPEYKSIPIRQVDESKESAYAAAFDYYLVPTFYIGDHKIHEGRVTYKQIKTVFEAALSA